MCVSGQVKLPLLKNTCFGFLFKPEIKLATASCRARSLALHPTVAAAGAGRPVRLWAGLPCSLETLENLRFTEAHCVAREAPCLCCTGRPAGALCGSDSRTD